MPFDQFPDPPTYLAPKAKRPEVLVDQYRVMLIDPTDGSMVGFNTEISRLGRLQYATRTPSNRGF